MSESLIAHCPRIFSKDHLPAGINPAWVTKFLIRRTYMWPELERGAHVAWQRKYETWEIPRFVGRTISEAAGGEGMRGWLILEKIYTCTLYILEVHIGKKRILHNSSVQKSIHARSVGWKKNLLEMLPGLTEWTSFPNCYDKKDCYICTCVPAKKDSQHKDLFLSNGFFFKFTTPVVTNLGLQGPRSLWAEWAIAPQLIPSFFVLFIYMIAF